MRYPTFGDNHMAKLRLTFHTNQPAVAGAPDAGLATRRGRTGSGPR